jgi:ABC-type multidrug transport system fused ATPase/permease subunit
MNESMIRILKSLWGHISYQRRRQAGLLLILAILASFAEIISLGAVLPFIGVLTQPDKVLAYPLVAEIAQFFGIENGNELVLPLTLAFALAAVVAGSMRLLLLWGTLKLGSMMGADLSVEVYKRTLYQPYMVHIQRSSSEVISGITQKVGTTTGVLTSLVTVITSLFLFVSILVTLIVVDPLVAFLSAVGFGAAYGIIAWLTRKKLGANSLITADEQSRVVKALQEGLGAIRDVLLDSTQNVYVDLYGKAVVRLRRASAENSFINQAPRFAMETLGLVLISVFVLFLSDRSGGIVGALPLLAMIAFGAQRLLPLMQVLYGNWALVAGSKAALIDVLDLLEQEMPSYANVKSLPALSLKKSICFEDVSFSYGGDSNLVLNGLDFNVKKGSRVGIIGSTGSGKSTALDLLMGLITPTEGFLIVDGKAMMSAQERASWRRTVAHVPQSIFLSDATVAENIAFGVPTDKIDHNRVRDSAKRAQIADFIESGSDGYDAFVGERGVRLSGGQRQRIGIARALYRNASVLVFDEATSALDDQTEQAVMRTIGDLSGDLTLFIIAHRLTTLRKCTQIIELIRGC